MYIPPWIAVIIKKKLNPGYLEQKAKYQVIPLFLDGMRAAFHEKNAAIMPVVFRLVENREQGSLFSL